MAKQTAYIYRPKCENCNNRFDSYKQSTMFCCDDCKEKYFEKKYSKII